MERLDYLIQYLLNENNSNNNISLETFPNNIDEKKRLYRALVNIRKPMNISDEYLKVEDEYLQEELNENYITDADNVVTIKERYTGCVNIKNSDKICLFMGDITKLKIGAIVNAGNSQGLGCFLPNHNCIDNQINTYAGIRLRLACNDIMKKLNYNLEVGKAIITKGFNLPADNVIQTVGPRINFSVSEKEEIALANCYINSLKLATEKDIENIAFPCISTGVFRFPKDLASKIAIKAVDDFISQNKEKIGKVIFCLYNEEDLKIYEKNIR